MPLIRSVMPMLFAVVSVGAVVMSVVPSAHASDLFDMVQAQRDKETKERCGDFPPEPSLYDKAMRTEKFAARVNYEKCLRRLEAQWDQRAKQLDTDMHSVVFQVHDACRGAVKRMSQAPDTLAFKDYRYEVSLGYNSANVETTQGGYSVVVGGSDSNGPFLVKCFMDKAYRVTAVR